MPPQTRQMRLTPPYFLCRRTSKDFSLIFKNSSAYPACFLLLVREKTKGVPPMRPKKYNTPHSSRVVKTRMTDEEYQDFTARLAPYDMSQAEFIRQAIRALRNLPPPSCVSLSRKSSCMSAVMTRTAHADRTLRFITALSARWTCPKRKPDLSDTQEPSAG